MLYVRLLGELALEADGEPLEPPTSRRARALLAWLALHPGPRSRAEVAARFWPDVLDSSARASLRTALSGVRRSLGPAASALVAGRDTVGLDPERLWVDAAEFEALVAADRLEDALALSRGDLLGGIDDDWALQARDEHRDRLAWVLSNLADRAEDGGDGEAAVRLSRRRLALDPLSEEATRDLMRRLAAAGDRAAAHTTYTRLRDRLRAELSMAPSAETRRLAEELRGAGDAGAQPAEPAAFALPARLAVAAAEPFVGRGDEESRLGRAWERAAAGRRTLVLVAGEPGIGKTRLAARVAAGAQAGGAAVLYGRCDEDGVASYQPFVEALTGFVAAAPQGELEAHVIEHGGELVRLVPELGRRVPAAEAPAAGDAEGRRARLFEAVAGLLEGAARRRPVLLVLDDLHWADGPTLLLLRHVSRVAGSAPLLVLGTYRETELGRTHPLTGALADLRREGEVPRVALAGLGHDDVERLIAAWTDAEPTGELVRAVEQETDGNPFFVVEVLRHLDETGALVRPHDGRGHAALAHGRSGVPEGVKEVIGRRLSRLAPATDETLGLASVIGREFDLVTLQAAADTGRDEVAAALDEALAAGLLVDVPARPGAFAFTHALVRETLYDELTTVRRVVLHDRVGTALEARYGEDREHAAELAHHFLEAAPAGDAGRAVAQCRRAAEAALTVLAYEDAVGHYERALAALELLDATGARRGELLLALGDARSRAGATAAAEEAFVGASSFAREREDAGLLARAALGRGGLGVALVGADPEIVAALEEALDALGGDDPALRSQLLGRLATELYYADDPTRRGALSGEALALARASGDDAVLARALNARRAALWDGDHLDERLAMATEMIEAAERAGDPESVLQARNWRVTDLCELADWPGMRAEIAAYAVLAGAQRLDVYAWYVPAWEAMQALLEGRWDDARALIDRAAETGTRAGDRNAPLFARVQGLALAHQRGDWDGLDTEAVERFIAGHAAALAWHTGLAWGYAELGDEAGARHHLDVLVPDGFAPVPRDANRVPMLCELAEAVAILGDTGHAARLYELLEPYAGRNAVNGRAIMCYGATDHYLGRLAQVLDRPGDAIAHYATAEALDERIEAHSRRPDTQQRHAEALVARGGPGDRKRALALLDAAELGAAATDLLHVPPRIAATRDAAAQLAPG